MLLQYMEKTRLVSLRSLLLNRKWNVRLSSSPQNIPLYLRVGSRGDAKLKTTSFRSREDKNGQHSYRFCSSRLGTKAWMGPLIQTRMRNFLANAL